MELAGAAAGAGGGGSAIVIGYIGRMRWLLDLLRDLWRIFFPDADYEARHWEDIERLRQEDERKIRDPEP